MFNIVVILPLLRWIKSPGGEFWQAFISSFIRCYHIAILLCQILATQNDVFLCFQMMVPMFLFRNLEDKIWVSHGVLNPSVNFIYLQWGSCIRTSDRADILLIAELSAKAFPMWPLFTVDGSLPLGLFSWNFFFVLIEFLWLLSVYILIVYF